MVLWYVNYSLRNSSLLEYNPAIGLVVAHKAMISGWVVLITIIRSIWRYALSFLWTPWRMEYIRGEKRNDCVFCTELRLLDGLENLIVYRGSLTFVILNRFPYTCGHLMVVPYVHKASLEELDVFTRSEIMENVVHALEVLKKEYQPQGFNMGFNIGEAAGAGVLDHVHFHVVPRWGGDTNFMSVLGDTRVLPESLGETFNRIKKTWGEV